MKTKLAHSDDILDAKPGSWLVACETARAVNMGAGGGIIYPPGSRFRVKFHTGDLTWCLDEEARSVTFGREDMHALEREAE